jgi:TatD DNase family protein
MSLASYQTALFHDKENKNHYKYTQKQKFLFFYKIDYHFSNRNASHKTYYIYILYIFFTSTKLLYNIFNMSFKMADSHTHLNKTSNIEELLNNTPQLKLLINIGTLLEDDFTEFLKHKEIYCTYGIHPTDYLRENSSMNTYQDLHKIQSILREKITFNKKCIGIGEIGLDFFHDKENQMQYDLLHMQLQLAKELKKPVSIHARGCNLPALIKIISSYGVKFVLHCYTYDLANALLAIEHGGYISFSGILTFGNKVKQLEEVASHLPKTRILVETDAPFLAPAPHRGKENHPKYLIHVLNHLAKLRNENIEETASYTFQNTCDLFNINDL